jgi:thymidylate kinase
MKDALAWLFEQYLDKQIKYCVLRNYDMLPEWTSNDVDLLIGRKFLQENEQVLAEMCRAFNWNLLVKANHQAMTKYVFYRIKAFDLEFLKLDFATDISWAGVSFVTGETILGGRRAYKTFFVPDVGLEAVTLVLLHLLFRGKVKEKYKPTIQKAARDSDGFRSSLMELLGSKLSQRVVQDARNGQWSSIENKVFRIRCSILAQSLRKNAVRQISNWFSELIRLGKRVLHPYGIFLVTLGPDGSGKTTVSQETGRIMEGGFPNRIHQLHWRAGILPKLSDIPLISDKGSADFRMVRNRWSGMLFSLLRLVYYTTDYILGYYLKIYPLLVRGHLVLCDRYFYDYFAHPERYNIQSSAGLIRRFSLCVPRPNLVICLMNEAETIRQRKQELSSMEIQRQLEKFDSLGDFVRNFHRVWTNKAPNEVGLEVAQLACQKLRERCSHHRLPEYGEKL